MTLTSSALVQLSVWHRPGLQLVAVFAQLGAGLLQQLFELRRVRVGAAWDLFATDVGVGAVDDGQAQFAIAVLWRPGNALKRLERVVGNQKSFVDTQRGSHGVFSLLAPNQMMCRRLGLPCGGLLVLMHATGGWVTYDTKIF